MWKQRRMILAQKRQPQRLVTTKPGVNNQADRNRLTIAKERLWPTASPRAIVLFKRLLGVVDQCIPNREDIFPARVCDKISSTSHCGASFMVLQPGRCHSGWLLSSSTTPN
jgi:hypothetical protein